VIICIFFSTRKEFVSKPPPSSQTSYQSINLLFTGTTSSKTTSTLQALGPRRELFTATAPNTQSTRTNVSTRPPSSAQPRSTSTSLSAPQLAPAALSRLRTTSRHGETLDWTFDHLATRLLLLRGGVARALLRRLSPTRAAS
jgi:hypothetical protein